MAELANISVVHDFVAETKGHCFLCSSSNINFPITGLESDLSNHYSLHYLARYLKLDMRKVFTGNGPIPSHLVARVEQSRLKAELCGECADLNKRFSKIYRKLERMEMEANSCLGLIKRKLERKVKFEGLSNEWMAKLEITEALRKDAKQKCSHKLSTVRPLTRLEKLTAKQVNAEKLKLESRKAAKRIQTPTLDSYSNYDDSDCRSHVSAIAEENEDGNDYLDYPNHGSELEAIKSEPSVDATPVLDETNHSMEIKREEYSTNSSLTSRPTKKIKINNDVKVDQLSNAIPPPIKTCAGDGTAGRQRPIRNPSTGKYKCPICSKEYAHDRNYLCHYNSSHLNVRYKCGLCNRDFPIKQNYERHYMSVHMGVRFKCGTCNRSFAQKGQLMKHQKDAHPVVGE